MTCNDALPQVLREIGGESDADPEARLHLAACAPCAEYRREAERVWQISGRAIDACPPRRTVFEARSSKRAPSPVAAAAAALIVAASLLAWAFWPSRNGTAARQDPDANAEELLRK